MAVEALMELDFGIETMGAMELHVLENHTSFGIRHPNPGREEDEDSYWAHILVDWLGLHEGLRGPEAETPEEMALVEKANVFLHRYWSMLENEWGDLIYGLIWAVEPRVSIHDDE